jgi:hypothetical protein
VASRGRIVVIYLPMQNKNTIFRHFLFFAALSLVACTTSSKLEKSSEPIQAQDKETANLADVTTDAMKLSAQTGKQNLIVVFDIDNTLLAMEQGLGADQWYDWQKALDKEDHCNPQNVGNRFAVQGALYFSSAMRPTQEDAATQVKAIQDQGISVIALTSRGPEFRLQTFRELRRNGYSFVHSAIGPDGGYDRLFIPVKDGRFSRYEDGVFMTAGQHKGQMLFALLEKTATTMPAVIIMADDKQKNLDAVKETFAALEIPVHAWRYTGEDENVRNFDPEQANAQWKSIEDPLRQIQRVLGPDNYDLSTAVLPTECQ